jgi:hypothetical protein
MGRQVRGERYGPSVNSELLAMRVWLRTHRNHGEICFGVCHEFAEEHRRRYAEMTGRLAEDVKLGGRLYGL